jgi:hypothetical protein
MEIEMTEQNLKPFVGMLASYQIGSDIYGGEITEVSKTGHQITWQRVDANGNAQLGFSSRASRRRNGEYRPVGCNYGRIILGEARTDLDRGF